MRVEWGQKERQWREVGKRENRRGCGRRGSRHRSWLRAKSCCLKRKRSRSHEPRTNVAVDGSKGDDAAAGRKIEGGDADSAVAARRMNVVRRHARRLAASGGGNRTVGVADESRRRNICDEATLLKGTAYFIAIDRRVGSAGRRIVRLAKRMGQFWCTDTVRLYSECTCQVDTTPALRHDRSSSDL